MIENETKVLRTKLFNTAEKQRSRGGVVRGVLLGVFLALALTSSSFFFRSKLVASPATTFEEFMEPIQTKKQLVAFVGVQTGFTQKNASSKYTYEARRRLLRRTWFPSERSALDKFEEESGIRVRFVIGHTSDKDAERNLNAEQEKHDDFVRLDFQENYKSLSLKTSMFIRYVVDNFDVQYIVKADDDIYLVLPRIPLVVPQWKERGADYIGCMAQSKVLWREDQRWYESQHAIIGTHYFAYALGSIYVLSGRAAAILRDIPEGRLRFFNNEDTTVGGWMVALNVTHFDERRLCSLKCNAHSLAIASEYCAGLCSPLKEIPRLHNNRKCRTLNDSLPLLEETIPVSTARSGQFHQTNIGDASA